MIPPYFTNYPEMEKIPKIEPKINPQDCIGCNYTKCKECPFR